MYILHNKPVDKTDSAVYISLLFGSGLIGYRVMERLRSNGMNYREYVPFSWSKEKSHKDQLAEIASHLDYIIKILCNDCNTKVFLSIVWSAGAGGFSSSKKELNAELITFEKILNFADILFRKYQSFFSSFHMLSSAGGLYEGQINVNIQSKPSPLRPYGWCKLSQEELLKGWKTHADKYCYRPSSVYGVPYNKQRKGIIPILLHYGMQGRVVHFSGRMDTIRDYIAAEDVAFFVSKKILVGSEQGGVFILANGQPVTLYQLKLAAERCIRRKIYAYFDLNPDNTNHNCFHPSILPLDWRPASITTGVRKIYNELILDKPTNEAWLQL